jgi:hypothetical protein
VYQSLILRRVLRGPVKTTASDPQARRNGSIAAWTTAQASIKAVEGVGARAMSISAASRSCFPVRRDRVLLPSINAKAFGDLSGLG